MKRAILLVLIYVAIQTALSIPLAIIAGVSIYKNDMKPDMPLMINIVSIVMLVSAILMSWFLFKGKYLKNEGNNFKMPSLKLTFLTICLTLGAIVFLDWLTQIIALPDLMSDMFKGMSTNFLGIITISLIGPILEELLFRGAIQGHMQKIYKNPYNAILLSALVFGVIHGNPAQVPFAFLMGLVLGFLYYRTESLIPCIIVHVLNNSLSTLLSANYPEVKALFEFVDPTTGYIMLGLSVVVVGICWYAITKMYPEKKIETLDSTVITELNKIK